VIREIKAALQEIRRACNNPVDAYVVLRESVLETFEESDKFAGTSRRADFEFVGI